MEQLTARVKGTISETLTHKANRLLRSDVKRRGFDKQKQVSKFIGTCPPNEIPRTEGDISWNDFFGNRM